MRPYDIFVKGILIGIIWADEIRIERIGEDIGEIKVIKDGEEIATFSYGEVRIEKSIWE
ncbi:MAG: hypothetical protein OCU22_09265 [Canidatus Methanoxibalbensis ujae]|nr:hypothetical protein [Candidatus Methanoxibalbensis ujae]